MRAILQSLILLGLFVGAAGCDASTSTGLSWGWLDRGRISRSILSGTTSSVEEGSLFAGGGETIEVTYDVTVRQGSLRITVWRPLTPVSAQKELDSITITSTRRGTLRIPVDEFMRYDVRAQPIHFGGEFDISWNVR